jgi:hypothetical protein
MFTPGLAILCSATILGLVTCVAYNGLVCGVSFGRWQHACAWPKAYLLACLDHTVLFTEAPKGLTAKHMDYGLRNMDFGFWIQYYQNQKIPKNKIN